MAAMVVWVAENARETRLGVAGSDRRSNFGFVSTNVLQTTLWSSSGSGEDWGIRQGLGTPTGPSVLASWLVNCVPVTMVSKLPSPASGGCWVRSGGGLLTGMG